MVRAWPANFSEEPVKAFIETTRDRNGNDFNSDDLEILPVRELKSCLRLAVPQS
ncbi:hypothetical protein CROQUDRAFT_95892 [Cronartium quercuum f. sp. fusiforme G11]|uniref:Uncharacterized protein n=1 Tax=Cronartium quercuum f. sp. fusiforme G11 TaxID=708437 RepID=A0A9P6NHL4_9BASI|nr:hypothetical protein CROQUDRAFT_95892 [Cronartium quercuum f. sp. fusiforme G11]